MNDEPARKVEMEVFFTAALASVAAQPTYSRKPRYHKPSASHTKKPYNFKLAKKRRKMAKASRKINRKR